jgi:hypothetical protein
MATTAFSIAKGMDVFSSDGEKFGSVGEMLSGQPDTQNSEGTPYSDVPFTPGGPISTEASRTEGSTMQERGRSPAPLSSLVPSASTSCDYPGVA